VPRIYACDDDDDRGPKREFAAVYHGLQVSRPLGVRSRAPKFYYLATVYFRSVVACGAYTVEDLCSCKQCKRMSIACLRTACFG